MNLSHRIPEEIKQDVIDTVTHVEAHLPYPPRQFLTYLFDIYNRYVNSLSNEDEDINCGGCRSLVIGKLRRIVREWKQQEQSS